MGSGCKAAVTGSPGAVKGRRGSMLLLASLEDAFQGVHRLQEGHNDCDVVLRPPGQCLYGQPASELR